MLDRSRATQLAWAGFCLALFVLLAVAVIKDWAPLVDVDDRGSAVQSWAVDEEWLRRPLRWVEVAFGTIGMAVLTTLLAAGMFVKGHRRAAFFTAGVMIMTSLTTTLVKLGTSRERPPWQHAENLLGTHSFPSGHASSVAAFVGVVMVLVAMLVRRSSVRRLVYVLGVVLVLAVCADRVFLGRHYPSDTLGGVLLGAFYVLLGIAIYNPLPRSLTESSEPLPDVLPSARRLAVVLNPIKVEDVGQFRSIVNAMALEAGWSRPSWHYTTVPPPA